MTNYLINYSHRNNPLDFFDAAFASFFRPVFYAEKFDAMKTDLKETPNSYEMEIEMPGFDKEDISVSVENDDLPIVADKKEKEEDKNEAHRYVRKERSVSCQRSYYIGDTEESTIKARYDKGVLYVSVPKKEEKKPEGKRSIAID